MNTKFWESARPGDDIQITYNPADKERLEEMLNPLELGVKLFGPFRLYESVYVEAGTIIFINNTERRYVKKQKWVDDLALVTIPLIKPVSTISWV